VALRAQPHLEARPLREIPEPSGLEGGTAPGSLARDDVIPRHVEDARGEGAGLAPGGQRLRLRRWRGDDEDAQVAISGFVPAGLVDRLDERVWHTKLLPRRIEIVGMMCPALPPVGVHQNMRAPRVGFRHFDAVRIVRRQLPAGRQGKEVVLALIGIALRLRAVQRGVLVSRVGDKVSRLFPRRANVGAFRPGPQRAGHVPPACLRRGAPPGGVVSGEKVGTPRF